LRLRRRPFVARLQARCSGPLYRDRSKSSWPRSQSWPQRMRNPPQSLVARNPCFAWKAGLTLCPMSGRCLPRLARRRLAACPAAGRRAGKGVPRCANVCLMRM
jgi:hypothetical protein